MTYLEHLLTDQQNEIDELKRELREQKQYYKNATAKINDARIEMSQNLRLLCCIVANAGGCISIPIDVYVQHAHTCLSIGENLAEMKIIVMTHE